MQVKVSKKKTYAKQTSKWVYFEGFKKPRKPNPLPREYQTTRRFCIIKSSTLFKVPYVWLLTWVRAHDPRGKTFGLATKHNNKNNAAETLDLQSGTHL